MLRRGARDLARAIAGVVDARSGAASRAGDALQRLHVARGPRSSSSPRDATTSSTALLSSSSDASGVSSPRVDVWRAWMGYGEGERGRRDDGTHPAGALARGRRRLRRTHAPRSTWDPERVFNDLIIKHSRRTESLLALIAGTHEDAWEIVTFENDDDDANAKDGADAMPVKREWRPVNVATAANRLVNVSLRTSKLVPPSNRLGAALAVLRDERYALLVRMIGATVHEFGPVETATTLKALASMQMYADNARIASPHQTLSRTSKRAAKKKGEEEEDGDGEKTDRVDLHLAEGLARAVRRNAHRMHARLLALTLPALRLLPGVTRLIDAETHATLALRVRLAARSGVLGAVEAANVAYAMTRIPPLLRVVNEPSNRTKGDEEEDEEEEGAAASCAAEIAARIAETAGDMDRRCVALSLDSITRLRLGDDGGDGGDGHLLGTLREALGAAVIRVECEVTPTRRLGSGTEWERMRAGLRRLGLEPPERWGTWPAGGRRGGRGRADGEEAGEGGPSKEGAGDE